MASANRLDGLSALLAFAGTRTFRRELSDVEGRMKAAVISHRSADVVHGVEFTDGAALIVWAGNDGFVGSDTTPPDPVEVIYYGITP